MELIEYQTVKEFLEENKTMLLMNESATQFILYNAMTNESESIRKDLLFAKIVSENDYRIV